MPTSLHVIRLAGVWEIARFVDSDASRLGGDESHVDGEGRHGRARLPTSEAALDWTKVRLDRLEAAGLPFVPCVCRRFFNRPTNLATGQPVYLEWIGLKYAASIRLDGLLIAETAGGAEAIRIRIDDRLVERNELLLVLLHQAAETSDVQADEKLAWPFHDCRLVIEERAS